MKNDGRSTLHILCYILHQIISTESHENESYTFSVNMYKTPNINRIVKDGYRFSLYAFNNPNVIKRNSFTINDVDIVENNNDGVVIIPKKELDEYLEPHLTFRFSVCKNDKVFVTNLFMIENSNVVELKITKHVELFTYIWCAICKENGKFIENYTIFRRKDFIIRNSKNKKEDIVFAKFYSLVYSMTASSIREKKIRGDLCSFKSFLDSLKGYEFNDERWKEHINILVGLVACIEKSIDFFSVIVDFIPLISNRILTKKELDILIYGTGTILEENKNCD
ncbi:hypothetical protein NGRA_2736 [Nosema granulosis]|uniref:Uncharacterized protein n=1 Tax=Nosema granulosis TaxID=83296 RepID=A0A9P6GXH3_9MICR|nr:hypothetical protein NGRA_2736 [Nosema granulosis]